MDELYLLWSTLLTPIFGFEMMWMHLLRCGKLPILLTAACGVGCFCFWNSLFYLPYENSTVPLAILAVLTGIVLLGLLYLDRHRSLRISPMSIKESFDSLPTGLCFYLEGGLPKLVNRRMNELVSALTGASLTNAEQFWEDLTAGRLPQCPDGGDHPIIRFPDGSVFSLSRTREMLEGAVIYEITASDITEEYCLTQELQIKQRRADLINTRLKALHHTIRYVIMEREVLQIKMRIHDDLGQTLLLTKRFLVQPEAVNKDDLLAQWRMNIRLLEHEESEQWQQPNFVTRQNAACLGVKLVIHGDLPEDEALIPLIDSAITVHITNVLRHAQGDRADIYVQETEAGYLLRFTNTGIPPAAPITETGGLSNIRRGTQRLGGRMTVQSAPVFEMLLELPRASQGTIPHQAERKD